MTAHPTPQLDPGLCSPLGRLSLSTPHPAARKARPESPRSSAYRHPPGPGEGHLSPADVEVGGRDTPPAPRRHHLRNENEPFSRQAEERRPPSSLGCSPPKAGPKPRLPGQRQGEGKQAVIGRKPPRLSKGCAPRRRRNPALRTAYPTYWLHPCSSHRPARLFAAPDSFLAAGRRTRVQAEQAERRVQLMQPNWTCVTFPTRGGGGD
ncbi:hypothetical protein J1605_001106 [Eschrichtius robustus]|uniref:Uncharacterized protein n=1 Tax=Eschrichtius robustus TaxID=9764 RepID=A0AB34GP86_ESCRO|nr:hypothetical protein J1605_001106 [Eschrichtius robustus]